LIVISVVVGFWNMSISIWVGCRIIGRSRKHMLLLCSKVGVNCRLGCTLSQVWCALCCISAVNKYLHTVASGWIFINIELLCSEP